jgi:formylglycine-generating enzyme required for sulfatase activity/tRNA A-37 threonylcarbamoyl transferase component Bud32
MSWNVDDKLHRDKRFVELLDNGLGKFAQNIWGDRYVLERDLYGGAWSETWLASRQGQKYVIKSLKHSIFNHPENKEELARYLRYFEEEARALAKCHHPHIVQIIEKLLLPLENNRPCIVMEYIEGRTLADWVKAHKQLPPLEAVKYVEQIGNALIEMHRQNYLHHDVKPQNIMIRDLTTTSGRCKAVLIDLGVARQFIPEMIRSYTFTPGSFGYCPPELELTRLEMEKQLLLNPHAEFKLHIEQSESIDVYSLAATLYFMITGRQPRDLPLGIPDYVEPAICDAITSGMARIPELRPKTIREWLVKLPLTFREVWRIDGKVLEFDPNDPNQGTYSLYDRRVNSVKARVVNEVNLDLGNGVALELVRVPAGKFMMGLPEGEGNNFEHPQHQVTLQEFWIGKYAVTNAQWQAVMKTKGSANCDEKFQGDLQPVVGVSWHDAREFCNKIHQLTGRTARLPTEAEWEHACRAGTTTPFAFGETVTPEQVNYNGNHPYGNAPKGKYREVTVNVNSFQPNAWGIYQMHGNVMEWCLDEWHDSYADKPENLKKQGNQAWGDLNVDKNDNRFRLLRGGSWYFDARYCRAADRFGDFARFLNSYFGFRLLLASSS